MIDVGTGNGAIALAIADEHPGSVVTASDVSREALALARENAERLGLAVRFVETSLLAGEDGPFDLVVSNPPYVTEAEVPTLMPEVRDFEPRLAVDGDRSGELAAAARGVLAPGGALVLESHAELAREVSGLLTGWLRARPRSHGTSRGGKGGRGAMAPAAVAKAIAAIEPARPSCCRPTASTALRLGHRRGPYGASMS